MNKIGFITNIKKDHNLKYTKYLTDWIYNNGLMPVLTNKYFKSLDIKAEFSQPEEMYKNVDFVVVLGGDGTILKVARRTALYNTPILGINFGTLGYLADVEKNDAVKAIENILNKNYSIEKRMMLETYIENNNKIKNIKNLALNEVCISNSIFSKMIQISMEINGGFIDSYRADGIIVSTPTGSTAYNLSAGGPILKPETELMAITYVCPHALFSRPFVIPGGDIIKIKAIGEYTNAVLALDGQQSVNLSSKDTVVIKRSKYYASIIKTTNLSFYDILRRKMVEVRK